jgi:ankyrin repeat protein
MPQIEYYIDVLGADIHMPNILHTAIKQQNLPIIKYLIEKGFDNVKNNSQILGDAIFYTKDLEIVKYIVSVGGIINRLFSSDNDIKYHNEKIRYLTSLGISTMPKVKFITPLYEAVRIENLEIIKYLVSVGANLNLGSITPLCLAVAKRNLEIITYLISVGADVNLGSIDEAIYTRDLEIVKYLVSVGADVNNKSDYSSLTPLEITESLGNLEIVNFLIENGAKRTRCSIL